MSAKPLEGVKILAASLAEAGPVCTQILALLGAKVVHIDRVPDGPDKRYAGGILRGTNKSNITLNTKDPEGVKIMWKLVEWADVFFENFAPGAWDRMGFSYEEVIKHNPEIIYVTSKGFTRASRWGKCITFDPVATSGGGGTYMGGYEDSIPMMSGINIADSGAAIHACLTVMLAILNKRITGKGQFIETPMKNAVAVQCRSGFVSYYAGGKHFRRPGNSYHGTKPCAPHNVYPTQGDDPLGNYIAIACSDDDSSPDFANLCKAIGREDLLADPRYATAALRFENRKELDEEISKWTIVHDKEEAMRILAGEYHVPAGAVRSPAEIAASEYMQSHVLPFMEDPLLPNGPMPTPTIPIHMSDCDIVPVTPGPAGTANDEVYKDILGLDEDYLAELREKRVI